jgi:hypothetical protein
MQPEDIPALVRDLVDPETIAALKVAVAEAEPSTH